VGTHRRLTEPIELRQALLCELHKAHDFGSKRSPLRSATGRRSHDLAAHFCCSLALPIAFRT
jgi:hypothetical protein